MAQALKERLIAEMKRAGAWDVRMADPRTGFEHVPEALRPLAIMAECRTVVVFCVPRDEGGGYMFLGTLRPQPRPPDEWTASLAVADHDSYIGYRAPLLIAAYIIMKGQSLLSGAGYRAVEKFDKTEGEPQLPLKPCAWEAGLGVYGRSGLILHPRLGNRIVLGALLTDAVLEPDPRLDGFDPCADCRLCVDACPAGAYGPGGQYHGVWSRQACDRARARLIAEGYSTCSLCWQVCPAGSSTKQGLFALGLVRRGSLEWLRQAMERTIAAQRRDLEPPPAP